MKGIILAGGSGSRFYPVTNGLNKQLLPVYDKPMIYYPFSTMIGFGIRDFCIISSPDYIANYKRLFGDGSDLGLNIEYRVQRVPRGIAQSFLIAQDFIGDDSVGLILGDNIFHGEINLNFRGNALIFACRVNNPSEYGVVEFLDDVAISIEEKPKSPKSDYVVPGLYFYDNTVVSRAKSLKLSSRGELEITDLNNLYLLENKLNVQKLSRGFAWLDAGTPEMLFQSGMYVRSVQERQGIKIGCIEEDCYRKNFINREQLSLLIDKMGHSEYRRYLEKL
jgi:glucose-1-phosphate thymidylyltransferase